MAVTAEAVKMLRERTGAGMMECKKALVEANGDLDAAAEADAQGRPGEGRQEGVARRRRRRDRARALRRRQACGDRRSELRDRLRGAREGLPAVRQRKVAKVVLGEGAGRPGSAGRGAGSTAASRSKSAPRADRQDRREHQRASLHAWSKRRPWSALPARHAHRRAGGDEVRRRGGRQGHRDARGRDQPELRVVRASAGRRSGARSAKCSSSRPRKDPKKAGKPPEMVEKIVEGKVRKWLDEITLLGQPFVKDDKQTVEQYLKKAGGEVLRSCATRSAPASRRSRKILPRRCAKQVESFKAPPDGDNNKPKH